MPRLLFALVLTFSATFGIVAADAYTSLSHGHELIAQATGSKKKKAPAKKGSATKKAAPARKKSTGKRSKKASAPARTSSDVKREQQATTRDIQKTAVKLDENRKSTAEQLGRLSDLRARISQQNAVIASTTAETNRLSSHISSLADSIAVMEAEVERLRKAYAQILKRFQGTERMTDKLAFVFSAESFSQGVARVRYMRQISRWRQAKSRELSLATARLQGRHEEMDSLLRDKRAHLSTLATAREAVERDSRETSAIVASLRKEGSALEQHLAQQQKRLNALDRELDRIIAAEQERARRQAELQARREEEARRRAAAKKEKQESAKSTTPSTKGASVPKRKDSTTPEGVGSPVVASAASSSFASMKGRLPFPVEGKYRVVSTFGRHPHPDIPTVQIDNSGIDIEMTGSSSRARVICDGTVSAVFRQPGYNNIVMIRHGNYLTVYAGLEDIAVRTGQTVSAGQTVGRVQPDPDNGGRRRLHFEVRREREKLNPLAWVR